MKKIALTPNCPATISVVPPAGAVVKWQYDERFAPVVMEEGPDSITLTLDDAHQAAPGFYAIQCIVKNISDEREIQREEYIVRIATDSDRAAMARHIAKDFGVSAQDTLLTSHSDKEAASEPEILPSPQDFEAPCSIPAQKRSAPIPRPSLNSETDWEAPGPKHSPMQAEDDPGYLPASPGAEAPGSVPPPPNAPFLTGPPLQGTFVVVLCRNGVDVVGMETMLPPDQTVLVGRAADCTLSLQGQFLNDEASKKCSRKQAEVFWRESHICIKNIGTNSLVLPGTPPSKLRKGEWSYWPVDASVEIPGGLSLRLKGK